jgi:hypothetical protein
MRDRAHWLAALLGGVFIAALVSVGGIWAQEPPLYGGPHISNPGAIPSEELKRNERVYQEHCRQQPADCVAGFRFTPEGLKEMDEASRYHGPYVPPDPRNTAPVWTQTCHPDPNNPKGPQI